MKVSFVIPVFNQIEHTRICLDTLAATLPANLDYQVILVDDASSEATRLYLSQLRPPHVVLHNVRNLGYAASNNRAARIAEGEFLALLNNDLVLQSGWLTPMLDAFASRPRAGVVGNIQLDAANTKVDHAGVIFRDGGYPVHYREPLSNAQARGQFIEYPSVTAACCLVRREWFLRTGGFDEGYRNGFEDTDLCLRAREDGFVNLVATRSVVHHHISSSEGRGAYEFRNAQRFLARWGPRAFALQQEWEENRAREWRTQQAKIFFQTLPGRLGFARRTVRRAHRAALAAERVLARNRTRPLTIGVDLRPMVAGGANGGVKPLVFSFLREIGTQRGSSFKFVVAANANLQPELETVLPSGSVMCLADVEGFTVKRKESCAWTILEHSSTWAPESMNMDVLYAPFGDSSFMRAGLPCVSLIVDLLHRDLPAALPIEEINHRHAWFTRIASQATYFQCISDYTAQSLQAHYQIHPARCFRTYIPAHQRLLLLPAPSTESDEFPSRSFFYYPANFWPHKNHETLLLAYRLYLLQTGSPRWPLVFTGHPDARSAELQEISRALGLGSSVRFLGHLPEAKLVAVWSQAGALVFPSLYEGFGIPLVEAMHFGVPILCANAASLPEVAGDAAEFTDPHDPTAIARSLQRISADAGLRTELVRRGRRQLERFSLSAEAARLAHFLEAAGRHQAP